MKKIAISLIALAALSGASFAASGSQLRESPTYAGKYSEFTAAQQTTYDVKAIEASGETTGLTAYQRLLLTSQDNDHGGRH